MGKRLKRREKTFAEGTASPIYKDRYKAGELKLTFEHGKLKAEESIGNKYHAKKTEVDGITFDSVKEARRYSSLKLLQKVGEIADLQTQVEFVLLPAQKGKYRNERSVKYVSDFCYTVVSTGELVVEDAKGMKTREYGIKRKLLLYKYVISVKEV